MQDIRFTNNVAGTLEQLAAALNPSHTFILVDENTSVHVLPLLQAQSPVIASWSVICIPSGDTNKNLDTLVNVWQALERGNANRKSLLVNLGGGVVTDLGGFAGATFKRGIHILNVPTTLLSAVDAAVGGKTGINFNGFKNEIGSFHEADAVIISTCFLDTLPETERLSGYAEMLKHGLIDRNSDYNALLAYDILDADFNALLPLLEQSVNVKRRIVAEDPLEHGIRRALNLGHTVGHAFESLAMERKHPVPHGYAVAWGTLVELILSTMKEGFPSEELQRFARYVLDHYGTFHIGCDDYPRLVELMRHDKKNLTEDINFTMLSGVGDVHIDRTATPEEIGAALDIYRDMAGI